MARGRYPVNLQFGAFLDDGSDSKGLLHSRSFNRLSGIKSLDNSKSMGAKAVAPSSDGCEATEGATQRAFEVRRCTCPSSFVSRSSGVFCWSHLLLARFRTPRFNSGGYCFNANSTILARKLFAPFFLLVIPFPSHLRALSLTSSGLTAEPTRKTVICRAQSMGRFA